MGRSTDHLSTRSQECWWYVWNTLLWLVQYCVSLWSFNWSFVLIRKTLLEDKPKPHTFQLCKSADYRMESNKLHCNLPDYYMYGRPFTEYSNFSGWTIIMGLLRLWLRCFLLCLPTQSFSVNEGCMISQINPLLVKYASIHRKQVEIECVE